MKEQLERIECAIDGVADELLEGRRYGNMADLIKVMNGINESLCTISYDLKDLVHAKKLENELKTELR